MACSSWVYFSNELTSISATESGFPDCCFRAISVANVRRSLGRLPDCTNAINDTLRLIEEEYAYVSLLSDTLTFDVPAVSGILAKHGHATLNKSRKGGYQGGYEVDSYTMGVLGLPVTTSWSDYCELKKQHITTQLDYERVHDHHPDSDAAAILSDFVAANIYSVTRARK